MADIVISSGHGLLVRGAEEYIDEVNEARRVVDRTAELLRQSGVEVEVFHDDESTTQQDNLESIVGFHNAKTRKLDISVHFNAFEPTVNPMGTEVCYVTQGDLAADVSDAIAQAGEFFDRGPKKRTDLYFLNHTEQPALLIEVCFVDSLADCDLYERNFDVICNSLANILAAAVGVEEPAPPVSRPVQAMICDMAVQALADFDWDDRGIAPLGYIKGFACSYAQVVANYLWRDPAAMAMAKADVGDTNADALAWYADQFNELGMDNSRGGLATLRHTFVLLMGLGMRESSGRYCEGRDMSAENATEDTAEAGLFQMSWNASNASKEIIGLYEKFSADGACLTNIYSEDVECSTDDLECYGDPDSDGYQYQELAKQCPQFAVEAAAVGVRVLRQHWGPINRHEVQLAPEVDQLLEAIQEVILKFLPEV